VPDWLRDLDERAFLWLNRTLHDLDGGPLGDVLRFADAMGSWCAIVVIGIASAFVGPAGRGRLRRSLRVVVGGVALVALVRGGKAWIDRARPQRVLSTAFEEGRAFTAFAESLSKGGFPSGHAATAFLGATLLSVWASRAGASKAVLALIWTLAGLAGLARVYSGAHFPLDVVAGAVAGVLAGLLGIFAGDRLLHDRGAKPTEP
jgi:membrane-associated phospholipid phosphatase